MTALPYARRVLVAGSLVLALLSMASVRGHAREQAPAPARAELLVDFLAVAPDGQPITDLKAEEITIRIDGRARPIRSLRSIQVGNPAMADMTAASALVPPPFGSNDAAEIGRSVMIIIEDESIVVGNEQNAKQALARFLGALSPRDRVGIVTVPHGGISVGMTTDHARVRQGLAQFVGRGSRSESPTDAACRSRTTLQSLATVFSRTRADDGPLTVLFFSSSMIGGRGAEAPVDAPNSNLTSRQCELNPEEFTRVAAEAANARIHMYIIQPEVVIGSGSSTSEPVTVGGGIPRWDNNPRAGLEHLAGVTGGQLLHLTGASGDTLFRVARQTSLFWVATIEPEARERNGQLHQVDVKLSRKQTEVHTRPDIFIARPVNTGLAPAPAPTSAPELLLQGRVYRDLPLRGVGFAQRGPTDASVSVFALLESTDATATMASAAVGLYDATGRLVNQWAAKEPDLAKKLMVAGLAAQPGTYRLRVAAIDTAGRAGTADYEVVAELTPAGPLKIGSLVLGLSRGGGYEPRLQFGSEPTAMAYLEIYGRPPGAGANVTLALELATSLNGPALVTLPGALSMTSDPDKFIVNAAIPIGALGPGDYVVRAIVGLEGQPAGRVYRVFRKQ